MPMKGSNVRGFHRLHLYAYCFGLVKRYLIGQPLSENVKTNATFWNRGTKQRNELEPPGWWSYLPHYKRAIYRHTATVLIGWCIYGWLFYREDTYGTLRTLFWTATVYFAYLCYIKSKRRTHFNEFVKPISDSIRDLFGISRHTPPRDFIRVPVGHQTNPERPVVLMLPKHFAQPETTRNRSADFLVEKLAMEDPVYHYELSGSEPKLIIRSAPYPPVKVGYDDIIDHLNKTAYDEWILGLGKGHRPIKTSFDTESPHVLLSMPTGGGKSEFCKCFALQALRKGFRVVILDAVKHGESAMWAKHIPGIEIITTIQAQHDFLVAQSAEVKKRQKRSYDTDGESRANDKPLLIIFEEANSAMTELTTYWKEEAPNAANPDKVGNRTGTSPAVTAIRHILNAGRSAQTHLLTVAQRAEANVCGGGSAREQYGVRVAKWNQQSTVKMLFPDLDPIPESPTGPGRVLVVIGGKSNVTQVPFFGRHKDPFYTEPAILEWALSPRTAADTGSKIATAPEARTSTIVAGQSQDSTQDKASSALDRVLAAELDPWISLRQALDQKVVKAPSLDALKKQLARDKSSPKPVDQDNRGTKFYDRDELKEWEANRKKGGGNQ